VDLTADLRKHLKATLKMIMHIQMTQITHKSKQIILARIEEVNMTIFVAFLIKISLQSNLEALLDHINNLIRLGRSSVSYFSDKLEHILYNLIRKPPLLTLTHSGKKHLI